MGPNGNIQSWRRRQHDGHRSRGTNATPGGIRYSDDFYNGNVLRWSRAVGEPDIPEGQTDGFYISHGGGMVHIVGCTENQNRDRFTVRIEGDSGTIEQVTDVQGSWNDRMSRWGPRTMVAKVDTTHSCQEISFRVHDVSRLTIGFHLKGHAQQHVYYGRNGHEISVRSPVSFDLNA